MPIAPLHFLNSHDIAAFMRAVNLQNYLLLGKQTILIARYTDEEIELAMRSYGAEIQETPDVLQLIRSHFLESTTPVPN